MDSRILNLMKNRRYSTKGKQYIMEYDSDFYKVTVLIRQRIYYNKDTSPEVFTPITRTIEERLRDLDNKSCVPTKLPFEPRKATACFISDTEQGYSEYSVFIPYRPNDDKHKRCLKEIIDIDKVEAIKYSGEKHSVGIKNYVSKEE